MLLLVVAIAVAIQGYLLTGLLYLRSRRKQKIYLTSIEDILRRTSIERFKMG